MSIPNIGFPTGLKPKSKFFEQVDDVCLNVDGCIALLRDIDTPQARTIRKAFRRRHAEARLSPNGRSPERLREDALFAALHDVGVRLVDAGRIDGSFDEGEPK